LDRSVAVSLASLLSLSAAAASLVSEAVFFELSVDDPQQQLPCV